MKAKCKILLSAHSKADLWTQANHHIYINGMIELRFTWCNNWSRQIVAYTDAQCSDPADLQADGPKSSIQEWLTRVEDL